MEPQQWLDLTKKFIEERDSVTEEEIYALRSNYKIWTQAIVHYEEWSRSEWFKVLTRLLKNRRLEDEVWTALAKGKMEALPEEFSEEFVTLFQDEVHQKDIRVQNIRAAKLHMKFLKSYDDEIVRTTGQPDPGVQEFFWKAEHDRLKSVIEQHRRSHVLANKQANGLDFALWAEVDLDEFHPSTHIGMTRNGRLPEMHER